MNKDVKELSDNLKSYIGGYPNTYTYTKNLAEKRLMQTRGHVNLVIFRPSIIACAYRQPFRAWTDTLSAAGGMSVLV
jgi:alcohol-forming fatty acyl-CoA reductase